jgi:1-acyl-sn-glycerol-3-phosphate acyltransferase
MELVVLLMSGGLWVRRLGAKLFGNDSESKWVNSHQALLAQALGWVLWSGRKCLGFEVTVSGASTDAILAGRDPVLVLARHGGPGDSFVMVHLLLTRYHRRVRIVLKDILQLDPVIDVLLNRLQCCFLPSATGATDEGLTHRLGQIAGELDFGEALLLFPEGANWTPIRRRRAIHHLREGHEPDKVKAAALMTNVLPPRTGGVFACLDARPGLDVVLAAHAGLDKIVRPGQAWARLPLATPMTVRFWPAAEAPQLKGDRVSWLTMEWATVDQWVEGYHAGAFDTPDR